MRDAGFDVHTVDGRVRVSPADRLSADQRTYIRDHKVMLVEELQAEAANDAAPALVVADPLAERIAELIADDWAPWCARARAESEALPDWKGSRGRATAERSVANPTIQRDPPQVGRAAAGCWLR